MTPLDITYTFARGPTAGDTNLTSIRLQEEGNINGLVHFEKTNEDMVTTFLFFHGLDCKHGAVLWGREESMNQNTQHKTKQKKSY